MKLIRFIKKFEFHGTFVNLVKESKVYEPLAIIVVSLAFIVIYNIIVFSLTGFTLNCFTLSSLNDANAYYIQVNNIIQRGFLSSTTGYHSYLLEGGIIYNPYWLYFGAHGIAILLPYVFLGSVLGGLEGSAILWIHLILLTIAFFAIYIATKSIKTTIVVQVLTFIFTPMLNYFPTFMMEIQMYFWSLTCVAAIYAYKTNPTKMVKLIYFTVVLAASAARMTNIIFIFPYIVEILSAVIKERRLKKELLHILVLLIAVDFLLFLHGRIAAPYRINFMSQVSDAISIEGLSYGFSMMWARFRSQFITFFNPYQNTFHVYVRYFMTALVAMLMTVALFKKKDGKIKLGFDAEPFALALIIASIAIFVMALYDLFINSWRNIRLFAPILFAVAIYTIMRHEKYTKISKFCTIAIIVSLIFLRYPNLMIHNAFNESLHDSFVDHVYFNPNAASRYENSVIIIMLGNPSNFWNMDPGLGYIYALSIHWNAATPGALGVGWIVSPSYLPIAYNGGFYTLVHDDNEWRVYRLTSSLERVVE